MARIQNIASSTGKSVVGLRDIAKQMCVSASTVSRALSGDASISSERTDEIRRFAEKVGYRPSPFRRKKKNAIGILIATDSSQNSHNKYFQNIIYESERCASDSDYHLHLSFYDRNRKAAWQTPLIQEGRVDGVILAGHPPVELCGYVLEQELPVVVLNDTSARTGCSCVSTLSHDALGEVIDRLIELGHRKIGTVITNREYPAIEDRYQAYCMTLFKREIDLSPSWVVCGVEPNIVGGRHAIDKFIEMGELPTAIVFANDWMALGGMNELLRRGYKVPEDVSIVGHDNEFICEELHPSITSIELNLDILVRRAFELLFQNIEGEMKKVDEKYKASLVWRKSCIAPRAASAAMDDHTADAQIKTRYLNGRVSVEMMK